MGSLYHKWHRSAEEFGKDVSKIAALQQVGIFCTSDQQLIAALIQHDYTMLPDSWCCKDVQLNQCTLNILYQIQKSPSAQELLKIFFGLSQLSGQKIAKCVCKRGLMQCSFCWRRSWPWQLTRVTKGSDAINSIKCQCGYEYNYTICDSCRWRQTRKL